MKDKVTTAIIIPSFNETLALPNLLLELSSELTEEDVVIVVDDSPPEVSRYILECCLESIKGGKFDFRFMPSGTKTGRGAAIRRGFTIAVSEYPMIELILECDADGSHRTADIMKIKNSPSSAGLLVGSRYLPASQIVGWPLSRRIFSWIINQIVPKILGVRVSDITNGLRRYSKSAVVKILEEGQINSGFIYLSEQAMILSDANFSMDEEEIIFINRTQGKSTVTFKEVNNSVFGILKIIKLRIQS